ncbi:hypothetical protein PIB30_091141, partial [Stylosanthes scabra]|nr:hypothetical protein [Stylosanthes scabra]
NQQKSAIDTTQQWRNRTVVTWNPPQMGQVKCNTDGAHYNAGSGATTAVFRNVEGKIITVNTSKALANSAIAVEAMTIRNVLKTAIQLNINNLIIETDCQVLYRAIKSKQIIAEIKPVLHDIDILSQRVQQLGFTWIPREANKLPHQFAALQQHSPTNRNWSQEFPTIIENIISNEEEIARAR